jgi:phosphatidylserine/phosphatidylglycerophosphate/cardiolipin synthase-like enzyme
VWWRTFFQWFGVSSENGWLPNPMDVDAPKLGLRAYLALLNYKANHRKLLVTDFSKDETRGFATLITSFNPHDGSSAHSNVAVRVDEAIWQDVIRSEAEVAWWSGGTLARPDEQLQQAAYRSKADDLRVQLLTEQAIETALLDELQQMQAGDRVDMAMFYLADRDIVRELEAAATRGAEIRLLLDPNKDAFGREKTGLPNRPVARELEKATDENLTVRWCDTHGEQCHSKLVLLTSGERFTLIQGSANLTRRNLENLNLETNVAVTGSTTAAIYGEVSDTFTAWWENTDERTYSTDYQTYADSNWLQHVRYRWQELTGLSRW